MQFKRQQREQVSTSWGPQSWFYQNLGAPTRDIIARAYGITPCSPRERSRAQEYTTLALSLFARKIGAEKSHVVHALLTNSLGGLIDAVNRQSIYPTPEELAEAWVASFREVSNAL